MPHAIKTNVSAKSVRSVARQRQDTGLEREKMTVRQRLVKSRFNHRRSSTSRRACKGRNGASVFLLHADSQKTHLVATRVIQAMQVRGLRTDGGQLYLELVEHTECLVELCLDVWHMGAEGVFVSAAVVTLEDFFILVTHVDEARR